MRIPKMKVLTGTMLSLLLSAVSVYPAMARPTGKVESGGVIGQTTPGGTTPSDNTPGTTTPSTTTPSNNTPSTSPTNNNAQNVTGTITKISGNVVTVRQQDGTTRNITLPAGEVARQNLKPGTAISATVDDQNVASSVSRVTRTTRTRIEEEQVTRRRTVQRRPAATQTQTTPQTTTAPAQQQPTETAPAAQTTTPVRALW